MKMNLSKSSIHYITMILTVISEPFAYSDLEPFYFAPVYDANIPGKVGYPASDKNQLGNGDAMCVAGVHSYGPMVASLQATQRSRSEIPVISPIHGQAECIAHLSPEFSYGYNMRRNVTYGPISSSQLLSPGGIMFGPVVHCGSSGFGAEGHSSGF